jgi:hypothetical protein
MAGYKEMKLLFSERMFGGAAEKYGFERKVRNLLSV